MPYSNPKQPIAAFLNIKRKQGLAAARAFGRKHKEEMGKSVPAYQSRKSRGTNEAR